MDKLICYDQASILVDLCKKIYPRIVESNGFFLNPKFEIADVIIWNELQDAYNKIKKDMSVDWASYNERLHSFDFQFTEEEFKSLEAVMHGRLNIAQMAKAFKKKRSWVFFQIKLAFCCQMHDLDGTSFITSNTFASNVISFLLTIPERDNCSMSVFFKIKPDFIKPHLLGHYMQNLIIGEWFDPTHKQFAFIGALSAFYLVLLKLGMIEMKIVEGILPIVADFKSEYKKIYADKPWAYNFVKKLETQSLLLAQSFRPHQTHSSTSARV